MLRVTTQWLVDRTLKISLRPKIEEWTAVERLPIKKGHHLVPVSLPVKVDEGTEDDIALSGEAAALRAEIEELTLVFLQDQEALREFTDLLTIEAASELKELDDLQAELLDLATKSESTFENPNVNPVTEPLPGAIPDRLKVAEKARKLWKKIAGKCHPDKTKRADFQAMYVEAKKAYQKLDVTTLESIFNYLTSNKARVSSLLQQLLSLRTERDQLRFKVNSIRQQDLYLLSSLHQRGETYAAVVRFKGLVKPHIVKELKARINKLDPSRYSLKPSYDYTSFYRFV